MQDALGDRMKEYESQTAHRLMPLVPAIARLDGRAFHSWTKGLNRPFDHSFTCIMTWVTEYLVEETNANIGYTQSDEITLIWHNTDPKSQIFFNGRVSKMTSILAAMASTKFNQYADSMFTNEFLENKPLALFDCRVWNVPNPTEAINVLIWREKDATRNSLQMLAQSHFSHKQLQNKNSSQIHDMLHEIGVNWNDLSSVYKKGTYIQRKTVSRPFTETEIEKLPPKHEAHTNPNLQIERTEYATLDVPPILKVDNKIDVFLNGKEPRILAETL